MNLLSADFYGRYFPTFTEILHPEIKAFGCMDDTSNRQRSIIPKPFKEAAYLKDHPQQNKEVHHRAVKTGSAG
jgi:hypothetical protein